VLAVISVGIVALAPNGYNYNQKTL